MQIDYVEFRGERISTVRRSLIGFVDRWAGKIAGEVLDVGCGAWTYPREALAGKCNYLATDHRPGENIDIVADLYALPEVFGSNRFDYLLCFDVFEHLTDPFAAAAVLATLLKPGGVLLATSPFAYPIHELPKAGVLDYWRITESGWRFLLKDFSPLRIEGVPGAENAPICYLIEATKPQMIA